MSRLRSIARRGRALLAAASVRCARAAVAAAGLVAGRDHGEELARVFTRVERLDFPEREIHLLVDSPLERLLRAGACHKEPATAAWIRGVARTGTFYDVGANVGSYALAAAAVREGGDRVVAFEPAYFNYAKLCRNILHNGLQERVLPLPLALAATEGILALHFSSLRAGTASHSFAAPAEEGPRLQVPTLSLDRAIPLLGLPFPNHLKIDVDGAEMAVLAGGGATFADPRVRTVLVEASGEELAADAALLRFLAGRGLELREQVPLATEGLFNALFVRP